jgi:hypothetical protein
VSTLKTLKKYLIGDNGYLLNHINNGKVMMLSGTWGAGKTHFWQNEIEPKLSEKLKQNNKACVYISLYGKDNIETIKNEILFKAYESIKGESKLEKRAISAFGFVPSVSIAGISLNIGNIGKTVKKFFESKKTDEAKSFLADGGLVCLDDFERKSIHIDLNDLFGFITQLAVDMECKIVIILNSDVFEGEQANIFKTVKEKTINKFINFEPTADELFQTISKDKKYDELNEYKKEIFKAIIETKELNARIYIQVLDNCLEWLSHYDYNKYQLRTLILVTINFIKNHFVFTYKVLSITGSPKKLYNVLEKFYKDEGLFEISNYFIKNLPQVSNMRDKEYEEYISGDRTISPIEGDLCDCKEFLHIMHSSISKKVEDNNGRFKNDSYYEKLNKTFDENKDIFYALYFYAYVLQVEYGVDKDMFDKINHYVQTGILFK